MIYDWYRGADSTGGIARRFGELAGRMEQATDAEALLPELEAIVTEEQDPNMRGYFLWYAGSLFYSRNKMALALEYFLRAYREFDPLEASFPAVASFYVATCHSCGGDWSDLVGMDDRDIAGDAIMALAILLWGDGSPVAPGSRAVTLGVLERVFIHKAEAWRNLALCELARIASAREHRCDTESPISLWALYEASYYLGRRKDCERIVEMLEKVDYQGTYLKLAARWGLPKPRAT
jgi:hypothetical protein